jgi:hypothetical protein
MSQITLGSHLTTPRTGYSHHGIYIGNQQLIHLTRNSRIEIVSLAEFTDGSGYSNHKYHSQFSRQEIVERAQSRLGNHDYSVVFSNCEHFVNWCIHDEHRSQQVRNVTVGLSGVASLASRSLLNPTPTLAGLTLAEITATTGTVSSTAGFALLSTTPILPATIVGFGVFKLVQFLSD